MKRIERAILALCAIAAAWVVLFGAGSSSFFAAQDIAASDPFTCDATTQGRIYFNTTSKEFFGCNATAWASLGISNLTEGGSPSGLQYIPDSGESIFRLTGASQSFRLATDPTSTFLVAETSGGNIEYYVAGGGEHQFWIGGSENFHFDNAGITGATPSFHAVSNATLGSAALAWTHVVATNIRPGTGGGVLTLQDATGVAAATVNANGMFFRTVLQANLPASTNGTLIYCSDCNPDATCTGSGAGAFAFRVAGAWACELN